MKKTPSDKIVEKIARQLDGCSVVEAKGILIQVESRIGNLSKVKTASTAQ